MKLCIISDTHQQEHRFTEKDFAEDADVLVHCGDISHLGNVTYIEKFVKWFSSLPYRHKVLIAGNHDLSLDLKSSFNYVIHDLKSLFKNNNIHYLENEEVIIDGVKFYGTPIQPWFCNWAFNEPDDDRREFYYNQIPLDTDVLITHCPPYNVLDLCKDGNHPGCKKLRERVKLVKPKIHCFGHIHEGYGKRKSMGVQFINASIWNHYDDVLNKPIYINI